jgi:fibronectin type 3 domain-containing protein
LAWTSVPEATSYNIYRDTTSNPETRTLYDVSVSNSYLDESVEDGVTYYYVVTAVAEGLESDETSEASATWYAFDSYCVYRDETENADTEIANSVAGATYEDTGVSSGHTYFYRLKSVDTNAGKSGYSNELSDTFSPPPPIIVPARLIAERNNKILGGKQTVY